MTSCLLDTDIFSEVLKGKNATVSAKAAAYLDEHGRRTTTSVSISEITYGLRRVGRDDALAHFEASLGAYEILPFDDVAALVAGRISADLERLGRPIGLPDVMIAAIAIGRGLPVVTGNVVHFEQVQSLGYEVPIDNWRNQSAMEL